MPTSYLPKKKIYADVQQLFPPVINIQLILKSKLVNRLSISVPYRSSLTIYRNSKKIYHIIYKTMKSISENAASFIKCSCNKASMQHLFQIGLNRPDMLIFSISKQKIGYDWQELIEISQWVCLKHLLPDQKDQCVPSRGHLL